MIAKERLQELIEQGATIWTNNNCPIKLITDDKHRVYLFKNGLYVGEEFENCLHTHSWWEDYTIGLEDLYENEKEAEFIDKNHTSRMEEFKPPFKLERGQSYKFVSKKYGNAEIWHSWENGREYIVTDERYECGNSFSFCTYDEAVEFARKLFLGKDS